MKWFMLSLSLFLMGMTVSAEDKIAGLGPVGPIKKAHTGFKFVEGPAADKEGNVYFSDIPNQRIHKVTLDGKLETFLEKSNRSNGLMFNGKGELVACEMEGQITSYNIATKERKVVAGKFNDARFNAPNDLVVDQAGGVYFTDPEFSAPKPFPQKIRSVYYVDASGKISRLIENDLPNPNGVILSIDEKTLYVIPSGSAEMLAYPVEEPGKLGKAKVFCTVEGPKDKGGDGLTIDTKGNLYIATGLGLQVFSPKGEKLGILKFPEAPSNATFGGKDFKTLYVTARTSLYTVEMEIAGHQFPGKK